jgi:RNA polymerase sigma-70 factor (ECF subfamily)
MNRANITNEKARIVEESQPIYPVGNKTAAMPDSSVRRYPYSNLILNNKEWSDEELVRSFVETKNREAFNEIVDRYADKIYRLALRIIHNQSDAEEILQEVFVILLEKLDTFHEQSRFSTWLYRVAANASFMHLRAEKKKYKNEVSLEDYVSYDENGVLQGVETKDWSDIPDEKLIKKETVEIIEKMVNELPGPYRIVFHLRDVEGLTNHEVAKILGISLPNVKSRVHRARLFLRDKLSGFFYANGKNYLYPSRMDLYQNR